MTATRPRDLLTDGLLGRRGQAGTLAADIARLAGAGYLNVALPPEFGGLGCTLRQAACGQRRLARHAPRTALAVSAHLSWTGAAADAYRAGMTRCAGSWPRPPAARCSPAGTARPAPTCGSPIPGHGASLRRRRVPVSRPGRARHDDAGLGLDRGARGAHAGARPQCVIAFAGRGARCTQAFRVARAQPAGALADVFTTSALTWGHSVLASVQYSDARRAFNAAITAVAQAATPADLWREGPG